MTQATMAVRGEQGATGEEPDVTTKAKRGTGVNRATLVGRLTADPETKYGESGTAVASMRLATNDREEPEFHDVVAFGKLAETVGAHLSKGRLVYVEGRLHTRHYETRTGQKKSTEIIADSVQFLDGRAASA